VSARIIQSIEELLALAGREVGVSDWIEVSQDRITEFADATGDHQWIHLDTERASRESPYRATVAHGFLSLSLLPALVRKVVRYGPAFPLTVNYGLNRVRFPAPVRAGAQVRGRFRLASAEPFEGGVQLCWSAQVEAQDSGKPCVVAEWLTRVYR
jgi:acyl dehydratase